LDEDKRRRTKEEGKRMVQRESQLSSIWNEKRDKEKREWLG